MSAILSQPQCVNHWNKLFKVNCHRFRQCLCHDDIIKWKHFPSYWPFAWWIHRSPVNSPSKAGDAELRYFLDLRLNKRPSNQSRSWFKTSLCSLWLTNHQCNGMKRCQASCTNLNQWLLDILKNLKPKLTELYQNWKIFFQVVNIF